MSKDKITEQESLQIINTMIQKAKASYYDTGIGPILWGSLVGLASFVTYFEWACHFSIGFDIWLLVLAAVIPQIVISIKEKRSSVVKRHEDDAINAVWLVFGISIFGLMAYRMITPNVTVTLLASDGWEMMKHYTDGSKPDEKLQPFVPSFYSLYILLYTIPTMITGIVKKFKPMIFGALISYILFIVSFYTNNAYDMVLGGTCAVVCWLIPGFLIRQKYLAQRKANV